MEPYTNMKAQIKLTNSHSIGEVPISQDIMVLLLTPVYATCVPVMSTRTATLWT